MRNKNENKEKKEKKEKKTETPPHPPHLSFVSDGERVTASPAHPTAAILAGVAGVLGGLVAPYEKVGIGGQRRQEEWLWGGGHHPFGPLSNTTSLSKLQIDTMLVGRAAGRRNA